MSLVILTNSQLCTISLVIFQFAQLKPDSWLSIFGRTPKHLAIWHISYLIFLILISAIIVPFSVNDPEVFIIYTKNHPMAARLLDYDSTILITFLAALNPPSYALAILEVGSSVFLFCFGLFYTILLFQILISSRNLVSIQVYRGEIMMFRAFLFKSFMMLVFYVIPLIGYTIFLWLQCESLIGGMVFNIIMVSHGWLSYLGTMLVIGPYRRISKRITLRVLDIIFNRTPVGPVFTRAVSTMQTF